MKNKVRFEYIKQDGGHSLRLWIDQQGFMLNNIVDFEDEPSKDKEHFWVRMIGTNKLHNGI